MNDQRVLVYFGSISISLFLSVARERGKVGSIEGPKFFIIRTAFYFLSIFFLDIDIDVWMIMDR